VNRSVYIGLIRIKRIYSQINIKWKRKDASVIHLSNNWRETVNVLIVLIKGGFLDYRWSVPLIVQERISKISFPEKGSISKEIILELILTPKERRKLKLPEPSHLI